MTDLLKPKWCTYCRKDSHNDSECWCTRPASPQQPCYTARLGSMDQGVFKAAFEQWKKDAAQGMPAYAARK